MYKSKEIIATVDNNISVVFNKFAYAASKLWNIGNYEKKHYKDIDGLDSFPDWYNQKKRLKSHYWYKNLPSQSAQNVLKKLQESWKSYFKLCKTKGIKNPKPPKYKQEEMFFTYLQNNFKCFDKCIRFSIPKQQKEYLNSIGINTNYLYLEIDKHFPKTDTIKEISIYPSKTNKHKIIVVYQVPDVTPLNNNGNYLSIDLGVKNLFTCYDNKGKSFIVGGNKFVNITHYFSKKIGYYQSIDSSQQYSNGVKYPKSSKRIIELHHKKNRVIKNLLHQTTRLIINYCSNNNINTIVIGDIKNIRKDNNIGEINNQKLHSLPFEKIYQLLEYKAKLKGITLIKQNEAYSSKCNPESPIVNKVNCTGSRVKRGLYKTNNAVYNADSVGAFNILRLYKQKSGIAIATPLKCLSNPIKMYPCN